MNYLPWVEKYRPKLLHDISHQEDVIKTLKKSLLKENLQHLLFYGPPGTGKTSTILAIARELFGPKIMKDRVMELNASNDRTIDIVRDRIKMFAKIALGNKDEKYPCPNYKIIILDEADCMSESAQSALRKIMETYSKNTRFCLICNYVTKIIEPIKSRCVKLRFQLLDKKSIRQKIKYICQEEKIIFQENVFETLINISDGDMRKMINLLQMASKVSSDEISDDNIREISGTIPLRVIDNIIKILFSNNLIEIHELVEELIRSSYPVNEILIQILPKIIEKKELTNPQISKICILISKVDFRLSQGTNEYIQLLNLFSQIYSAFNLINDEFERS